MDVAIGNEYGIKIMFKLFKMFKCLKLIKFNITKKMENVLTPKILLNCEILWIYKCQYNVSFVMKLLTLGNICTFTTSIMISESKNCCNWFFYKNVFLILEDDMMLLRFTLFPGYKDDT